MLHRAKFQIRQRLSRSLIATSLFSLVAVGLAQPAHAIVEEALLLLTEPLDLPQVARYRSGAVPADGSVVTETTISQTELTIPSLWWAEEQFGGKLLDYWVAYRGAEAVPRRVDLLVNQQVWAQYNYLERYAFITHFGTSASDFGYNTRIFNWQGDLLGAYVCEFDSATDRRPLSSEGATDFTPSTCQVFLDSTGAGALSGAAQLGAPLPTTGGTD